MLVTLMTNRKAAFFGRLATAFAFLMMVSGCASGSLMSSSSRGGTFLPNQWNLRPAGESIPLGDLPVDMALSPDGRLAAISQCGYGKQGIRLISIPDRREVASITEWRMWHGITFSSDGKHLYASGGADDVIYRFTVGPKSLTERVRIPLREKPKKEQSWYPSGVAVDRSEHYAYVGVQYGNRLLRVDLQANPPAVETLVHFKDAHAYPYEVLLSPDEKRVYVSLWGGKAVAQVNLADGKSQLLPTDSHPCEMTLSRDGSRLFVACANTNAVDVLDTESGHVTERLTVSLYPKMPEGSTPNAVALSNDGTRLFAANANNNTLAVFDVSEPGQTRPLGFIPTGWYPTAVAQAPDSTLLVVNGKGNGSKPNPGGPNPTLRGKAARAHHSQYIGGLLLGSLSFIPYPDATDLAEYTRRAYLTSPLRPDLLPVVREPGNPIPTRVGDPSPIKYCVYIIKENRTYDQVFGDIKEGNGDASICLFPEKVSPNHHSIVKNFVLLDNFYVESEVSADGHEWSTGAYANDFVEKSWPADYGGHADYGYKSEGTDPVTNPQGGYLWDRAKEAGITYYDYGEWIAGAGADCKGHAKSPALVGHFNPCFREFDVNYSDLDRVKYFLDDMKKYDAKGDLPQLIIMHLPNDHTAGSGKGRLSPLSYVAQNDLALGEVLEALSKSPFWKQMAVFVVEDDAQNGPDHVDCHRTVAMVAGGYVKRHYVDHTMYSTASMLRTMELILGMKPMSQFDAAARPMYSCFTSTPDATPYVCLPNSYPLDKLNPEGAPMQKVSDSLDFDQEDRAPDLLFSEIIWKAVRGADSEMPPPVHAAFVRPIPDKDGDRDTD